jgi:hypothetical protein
MLTILTGLPKTREQDYIVCQEFLAKNGKKAICGSSTMKMFCRELNIEPKIEIINENMPQVRYYIPNIDLASEGAITLNVCYKILKGTIINNFQANVLTKLIKEDKNIFFIIGTAETDISLYERNNILPRFEITKKIINYLKNNNFNVSVKYF